MEIKIFLRRFICVLLIIVVGFLLQTSVFSNLELAGVGPNILVAITASFGFMKGRRRGMTIGFFCGLLLDLFSGTYFGMMALLYMYIGYLNGFFKKMFFGDDLKLPLTLIGVSDVVYGLIMFLASLVFVDKNLDFLFYLQNMILPEMVYTVLVSIIIYYLILKIDKWLEKAEKKRGYGRFDGAD